MVQDANVRITDADVDDLVDYVRRLGRPVTLDELVQALREIWRRRRGTQ
jgi:hypothetical protein